MNEEAQVRLLIMGGMLAMILMAAFIVLFLAYYKQRQLRQRELIQRLEEQHQRDLLRASLESQEAERRRIAAHLHDDISTMLSATRMSLSRANKHLTENPDAEAAVRQARELLEETVNNVRRISKELLPSTLDDLGLVAALEEFVTKLRETTPGVEIEFTHEGYDTEPATKRPTPRIELAVFRVAQELVHNSLKHAQARHVSLLLIRQPDRLLLTSSDDGVGFDLAAIRQSNHGGLGLKNIESRLNVINGRLIFDVAPNKGAYVIVDVPLSD